MGHWRRVAGAIAGLAVAAGASPLAAQGITDPTKPAPPAPPAAQPGAPAASAPSAFTFTAAYTADLLDDVAGGRDTGAGYADLLKLSAAYDGSASGHDGLTGLVSVEHVFGSDFTPRHVGGVQNLSADEADPGALRLYEAWLQQAFAGGAGAIKAGLVDINTTFDVQETAALFLNASQGLGPDIGDTGRNGPSDFPTPAPAVTGFYRPSDSWTAQLGIFDAVAGDPNHRSAVVAVKFDGALIIGQLEKRFADVARMEAGAWIYTSAFPSLDRLTASGAPVRDRGDAGVYGLVEGRLLGKGGDSGGGLDGWLRIGAANGDIHLVSDYVGAGLVYTGLLEGRDKDEIGLAIARAGLGAGARVQGALAGHDIGGAETDLEATYRYAFKDWLNIQPDLQWVIHPHGEARIPGALVVGLRLAFTYSR